MKVLHNRQYGKCGICSGVVDMNADPFTPLSPVKDHIIPLSRGGEHSYSNMQLAHWSCNAQKGAKLDGWQNIKPIIAAEKEK